MRILLITLLLLFFNSLVYAGLGLDDSAYLDGYYQDSGYYLKSIKTSKEGGLFDDDIANTSDVYIYYPDEEKGIYIFNGKNKYTITTVLYETAYDANTNTIVFNDENNIKNNFEIKKRDIKQKILIETYNKESNTYILWVTNKRGENIKKIIQKPVNIDWHIDVRNSKIRFVNVNQKSITIESITW